MKRLLLASFAATAGSLVLAASASALTLSSPLASGTYVNAATVNWNVGGVPLDSAQMIWTLTGGPCYAAHPGEQITLVLAGVTPATVSQSFSLNPANPTASTDVASASGTFCDGTYSVHMTGVSHASQATISSGVVSGVQLEYYTPAPALSSPLSASITNTIPVSFDLPEAPAAGSVQLALTNESTNAITTLQLANTQNQSFTLTPTNLAAGGFASVMSGPSSLTDGTYTVSLSYSDAFAHAAASSPALTWTLETATQTPAAPSVSGGSDGAPLLITYDLPEAALADSVVLNIVGSTSTTTFTLNDTSAGSHTLTLAPGDLAAPSDVVSVAPANATLTPGSYTVSLTYRDALGNPAVSSPTASAAISAVSTAPPTTPTTTPTPSTTPTPTALGTFQIDAVTASPTTGALDLTLAVPQGGELQVSAIAKGARRHARFGRRPAPASFAYARLRRVLSPESVVRLTVAASAAGRRLLAHDRRAHRAVKIRVTVIFTPSGGTPQTQVFVVPL